MDKKLFQSDTFSKTKIVLTLDDRRNIIAKVQAVLNKEHSHPERQVIHEHSDRLNFACPYCGDSSSNAHAKRGNLYWDSLYYHCYNDACNAYGTKTHFTLLDFLRNFKEYMSDEEYSDIMVYIRSHKYSGNNTTDVNFILFSELNGFAIDKDEFIKKHQLFKVSPNTYRAYPYLKSRLLHTNADKFLWNPKTQSLYIPNYTHNQEKIIGYQTRKLGFTKGPKYLSHTLKMVREEMGMDGEIEDKFVKMSMLYNILGVNFSHNLTVFEGPLDSMFMANSIAVSGLGKDSYNFKEIPTIRYFYDNDRAGKYKMIQKLKDGEKVFMWNKLIDDFDITYKIKDFNDLIKYCYAKKRHDVLKAIDSYFTNDPLDMIYI